MQPHVSLGGRKREVLLHFHSCSIIGHEEELLEFDPIENFLDLLPIALLEVDEELVNVYVGHLLPRVHRARVLLIHVFGDDFGQLCIFLRLEQRQRIGRLLQQVFRLEDRQVLLSELLDGGHGAAIACPVCKFAIG